MQLCPYCQYTYPEEFFGIALTTPKKVYRRKKCKYCYQATKARYRKKIRQWVNHWKETRGCYCCGLTDFRCLEFHHPNNDKEFAIGEASRLVGYKKLKVEMEKCEVICTNCHRILHYNAHMV